MTVVLDSSAVLAAIFGEEGSARVIAALESGSARIGSVNLAEIATRLVETGYTDADVRATLADLGAFARPFEAEGAVLAGLLRRATRHAGLSLGERACLAEALLAGLPVVTADRAWAGLDLGIRVEVIR
ncbi:MAG: type II toxin-antitoxin system VapC family toxin [Rhodobacteraceae bacterium]|nr:type II toxin-antitoxin system VapC family toxin [Paracoccaceae bacterium]